MNKKIILKDEFLAGVFVFFFIISYLGDTYIYSVPTNLKFLHAFLYGISSIGILIIVKHATKKGLL